MFYQYNNLIGRITPSQSFQPYFPVAMKPVSNVEPPQIVFASPNVTIAKESPAPRRGTGGAILQSVPESLKQKQMFFQKADGVLVHLKGGPLDKALFGLTVGLCGVGIACCFKLFYDLSVPKK